ncbi:MAG: DUF1223 domain-containing protein [Deltaproteobacteria bacterium]|nr:DUF1223 domain-containing protein [Deltaproteobacteria bacterium]
MLTLPATLAMLFAAPVTTPAQPARVPVLLELFTSEGCSSCPPADVLLAKLQAEQGLEGVEVIALSEHVDYWNYIGWSDPYSSKQFTERQRTYAPRISGGRVYTPQAIVDGEYNLVGSDGPGVRQALLAAAQRKRGTASLEVKPAAQPRADHADKGALVSVALALGGLPADGEVWLAVVEDGLVSKVTAGENEGRTLPHAAVVRSLRRVGSTKDRGFTSVEEVRLDGAWKREALRVIAFAQEAGGPVLAAGSAAVPK